MSAHEDDNSSPPRWARDFVQAPDYPVG